MFSIILWSSVTRQNKKDTLVDAAARGRLIALLFPSLCVHVKDFSEY